MPTIDPTQIVKLNALEKAILNIVLVAEASHVSPQFRALAGALINGTLTKDRVDRIVAILNETA